MPAIATLSGAGRYRAVILSRVVPIECATAIFETARSYRRISRTYSPMAKHAVNPGDSMPNKLTKPGTP